MSAVGLYCRAALSLIGLAVASAACGASLCEDGKRQSPIDIPATTVAQAAPLRFDYRPMPLTVANDGHTLRVRLEGGGFLQVGKQRYRLQQFHFHTPGGDQIRGESFPMAAHLLHKSDAGQLLALVVLFRLGAPHPALDALWSHLPEKVDGDHRISGEQVDARALLPANPAYYRYSGSLTAAPCTEGVEWIVMKTPVEISAEQLRRYKTLFADNARAPQPLNQRVVQESP